MSELDRHSLRLRHKESGVIWSSVSHSAAHNPGDFVAIALLEASGYSAHGQRPFEVAGEIGADPS